MEKRVSGIVRDSGNLQKYLQKELGLTRRQISGAKFRPEGILVNGVQRRVSAAVYPGDQVEVLLEEDSACSAHLIPVKQELEVLYEDEDILAVNKPAGLVVHPSHGHYQDSLANAVYHYFAAKNMHVKIRPVGRLDKETSGIVLFAKSQAAAARLAQQKEQGIFQKQYLALVEGCPIPGTGTITAGITKDTSTLMKMKVSDQGRRAVTHYEVLKSNGKYALVALTLETGRTHQIRVHMASAGHPLLGDQLYGSRSADDPGIARAALHAGTCIFRQPFSRAEIRIEAEMPEDMKNLMMRSSIRPLQKAVCAWLT